MRVLGLFSLKYIFQNKHFDSTVLFLLIFIILGILFSEMIFLGFANTKVNNAMWFSFQALMACWLLVPFFLLRIKYDRMKQFAAIVLIIFLSIPGSMQFLSLRFKHSYFTINSNALEVTKYLDNTPPKSVIFHSLEIIPSVASNLSGRSSVLSLIQIPVIIGTVGIPEAQNRFEDIQLFFNPNAPTKKSDILEKYEVDYVLVFVQDSESLNLNKETALTQVFRNNEYVIYKVDRISNERQEKS